MQKTVYVVVGVQEAPRLLKISRVGVQEAPRLLKISRQGRLPCTSGYMIFSKSCIRRLLGRLGIKTSALQRVTFCSRLSASSLRSAPGGIAAAPEQPFLAAQALTSVRCARVDFIPPLNPLSRGDSPAPAMSRSLYRLMAI